MLKFITQKFIISLFAFTSVAYAQEEVSDYKIDLKSYELNYDIPLKHNGYRAPRNRLTASVVIKFENSGDKEINQLPLILNRLMTIQDIKDIKGNSLDFSQQILEIEGFEMYQANISKVVFKDPVKPGEIESLTIHFKGALAGAVESGMVYTKESLDPEFTILRGETLAYPQISEGVWLSLRKQWLDYYTWEANITVPKSHVVANGQPFTKTQNESSVTYSYKSQGDDSYPILSIAPYKVTNVNENRVFSLPGSEKGGKRVSREMELKLSLFEDWFGPLPNEGGLSIIEIPVGYGSQALYPTIIQTSDAFNDPSGINQLYHELTHLWNINDANPLNPRLNEGLATFLQYYTSEYSGQEGALKNGMEANLKRTKGIFERSPENKAYSISEYGTAKITDMSYRVGALFYSIMFNQLGEKEFFKLLKNYYQDNRGGDASLRTMAEYYNTHAPIDLNALFEDWCFTTKYVEIIENADKMDDLHSYYPKP